jgi:hypothetical protein
MFEKSINLTCVEFLYPGNGKKTSEAEIAPLNKFSIYQKMALSFIVLA